MDGAEAIKDEGFGIQPRQRFKDDQSDPSLSALHVDVALFNVALSLFQALRYGFLHFPPGMYLLLIPRALGISVLTSDLRCWAP